MTGPRSCRSCAPAPAATRTRRPGGGRFRPSDPSGRVRLRPNPASSRTANAYRHRVLPPVRFTSAPGHPVRRPHDATRGTGEFPRQGLTSCTTPSPSSARGPKRASPVTMPTPSSAMRAVADEDDHPTTAHFDTTIDNLREHPAAAVSTAGSSNLPGNAHPDARDSRRLPGHPPAARLRLGTRTNPRLDAATSTSRRNAFDEGVGSGQVYMLRRRRQGPERARKKARHAQWHAAPSCSERRTVWGGATVRRPRRPGASPR